MHLKTFILSSDYVEQNCYVLVMTIYNPNLAWQHIMEGKFKILETNEKSENIRCFYYPIFYAFGDFSSDSVDRKRPSLIVCTKTPSPGIFMVLHW